MSAKKTISNEKFEFGSVISTPSGIIVPDIIDKKTSKKWISWGENNLLPNYLWDNYLKCSNLQAIINTMMDYIIGEGISNDFLFLNENSEFSDTLQKAIFDYILFGGFALEGIRNASGDIVVLNYINVMTVRVNEDLNTAFLSPKWGQYTAKDMIELPIYNKDFKQPHFIYYYRGSITRGINPVPCYISAMKSIEILNNTRNFHLRNLENGFTASAIISLNNGTIKQRELQEIKEKLDASYTGSENAGKYIIINAQDKDHCPTIEKLSADNFGDLYQSLSQSSTDDLYVAFRINKMLVGCNVETGFSREEFSQAYKLYYKTVILPLQKQIQKAIATLGVQIEFSEFKIEWDA